MPLLPLTRNQFSQIDEIDLEAVIAVGKWSYNSSGYAVHYWTSADGKYTLYLHRFIYARVLNDSIPLGLQIDHISGNKLENQRSNLRLATASQNQAAKKSVQTNSRSGHKGVTLRAADGKFDVRIRYYHQRLCLGRFVRFEVAVAAYKYAHRKLWGEFTSEEKGEIFLPEPIQDKIDQMIAVLLLKVASSPL